MRRILTYSLNTFTLLPFLAVLYLSLVSKWMFPDLWKAKFTLKYWAALFAEENTLLDSFYLSISVALTLSVTATLFGFWISKLILLRQRVASWLQLAFYPYLIAPVILGVMLQYYFVRLGLSGSFVGVMLAQSFFIFPYSVLLFSSFWSHKVKSTVFQAITLGANEAQINMRIILPMAHPWIVLSLLQCFLISWFEYGITHVIGVGKVQTLTIKTMHFIKEADPHQAALSAMVLIIPVMILFIISYHFLKQRFKAW